MEGHLLRRGTRKTFLAHILWLLRDRDFDRHATKFVLGSSFIAVDIYDT